MSATARATGWAAIAYGVLISGVTSAGRRRHRPPTHQGGWRGTHTEQNPHLNRRVLAVMRHSRAYAEMWETMRPRS